MPTLTEELSRTSETQFVVFKLEDEEYAVEIHEVREIIKMVEITPIPRTPEFIKGIINLRGKIVVVTDLKERFNITKEQPGTHIVIVEIGGNSFGIIVDDISEVLKVNTGDIKKVPSIITDKIHVGYLKGVIVLDKRLIVTLDTARIFSEKELEAVSIAEEHGKKEEVKPKPEEGKAAEKTKKEEVKPKPEEGKAAEESKKEEEKPKAKEGKATEKTKKEEEKPKAKEAEGMGKSKKKKGRA